MSKSQVPESPRGSVSQLVRTEKGVYQGGVYSPDWEEYCDLIERLSRQIEAANYKPDCVIALARGGLTVGNILSRKFNCPLGVLAVQSARKGGPVTNVTAAVTGTVACSHPVEGRLLLVDDLVESGASMASAQAYLKSLDGIQELKTGVLWRKVHDPQNKIPTDFCAMEIFPPVPWIVQPFEQYDREQPVVL